MTCSPYSTLTHEVFPPNVIVWSPGAGIEPRTPQNVNVPSVSMACLLLVLREVGALHRRWHQCPRGSRRHTQPSDVRPRGTFAPGTLLLCAPSSGCTTSGERASFRPPSPPRLACGSAACALGTPPAPGGAPPRFTRPPASGRWCALARTGGG